MVCTNLTQGRVSVYQYRPVSIKSLAGLHELIIYIGHILQESGPLPIVQNETQQVIAINEILKKETLAKMRVINSSSQLEVDP